MVYALSIAFVYYVFFAEEFGSTQNIIKINIVFLLGVFIHFLFGFIYVLYLFKLFALRPHKLKKHLLIFSGFSIFYLPLLVMDYYGLFYLGPGTKTGFGVKNILYIIYAFLGFAGLGISRNDLRAGNFAAIGISQIACMGILVIALMAIAMIWLCDRKKIKIDRREMLGGVIAYFAVWFLFALPIRFGLWERHCIGVLPVYILAVMDLLHYMVERGKGKRFAAVLYAACLMVSAANMRFNYYYACDDYKGVSEYLQEALKQNEDIAILYASDVFSEGKYYDITPGGAKDSQHIIYVKDIDEETIDAVLAENAESDKVLIVLFEKAVSSKLWHTYDGRTDLNICDAYNSFRIVEY